ncbi:MAG: hypothetical protein Q8942_19025 [Bacillota bacterium]|nr:hypothetical protein [Bacillota bacterium]
MQQIQKLNDRTEFAIQLLLRLKDIHSCINKVLQGIEENSEEFFNDFFEKNVSIIQSDLDNYLLNLEKISELKAQVTDDINKWFSFAKNADETRKLSYPLKFYLRKRSLRSSLKSINDNISSLSIENRFIKEKLMTWKHDMEIECIRNIKKGDEFFSYENLIKNKNTIMEELKYILPTIEGLCPISIDLNDVEPVIEKLSKE